VHGSAPDIAGKGLANPLGAILTGALLLSHLGLREEAQRVEHAVGRVTGQGVALTADLGGSARTADVVEAVLAELRRPDDGGGA